jgi:drug/metabolite transporter superfamily protein YnfA
MLHMVGYLLSWRCFGGLIFEGIVPDMFDVIGAAMACAGVAIIYYAPRRGEEKLWSNH